jgi:hypothetical protein
LSLQVASRYAYVLRRRRVTAVDARSGRLVNRASRRSMPYTVVLDGRAGTLHCQ